MLMQGEVTRSIPKNGSGEAARDNEVSVDFHKYTKDVSVPY